MIYLLNYLLSQAIKQSNSQQVSEKGNHLNTSKNKEGEEAEGMQGWYYSCYYYRGEEG